MTNLYVTTPGAIVRRDTNRLVVTKDNEELASLPIANVENVVLVGGAQVTTPVLTFLLDRGIGLILLSGSGRFRGRLAGDLSKNVALRRLQYRRADDAVFRLGVARAVVAGKLGNCRVRCLELDRTKRDGGVRAAADELQFLAERAGTAPDRTELLGIEGLGTNRYYAVLRQFLRPPWVFERRARRPPPDPVNALLSLIATFLHGTCVGALEAVGLDPSCGFLHDEHYGRSSLALDLMEEFRPVVADALAFSLLNRQMLRPNQFTPVPEGGVHLTPDGWSVVTAQYRAQLRRLVQPPGSDRRLPYLQLIEEQARKLRAAIEGATPGYLPYRAR